MAQQFINVGTNPNDGSGDALRAAGQKINANFTELYGQVQTAYLTGDQATQSASAVNITGLAFTVGANEVWAFEWHLGATASAVAGIRMAVTVPSGATLGAYVRANQQPQIITASGVLTASAVQTVSACGIDGYGLVQVAATAGTVQLQFASGDGTATATIKGGQGFMSARRVG